MQRQYRNINLTKRSLIVFLPKQNPWQIGYNFLQGDDKFTGDGTFELDGGPYWGAGVDIEIGSFIIGAIFRNHKGTASVDDFSMDIYYNTISAGIGFNF